MALGPSGRETAAVPLLLLLLVGLALVALVLFRANELFVLSARGGRVLLLRGKLPGELERELVALVARQVGDVEQRLLQVARHLRVDGDQHLV